MYCPETHYGMVSLTSSVPTPPKHAHCVAYGTRSDPSQTPSKRSNTNASASALCLRLRKLLKQLQHASPSCAGSLILLLIILRQPTRPPTIPNRTFLFDPGPRMPRRARHTVQSGLIPTIGRSSRRAPHRSGGLVVRIQQRRGHGLVRRRRPDVGASSRARCGVPDRAAAVGAGPAAAEEPRHRRRQPLG